MVFKNGVSFSGADYSSDIIFRDDLRLLAGQWVYVDHVSILAELGSYSVHLVCGESIILVRTESGIKGFFNFCRHRGSVLCKEARGQRSRFVCPYHGWTYGLDGQLQDAPALSNSAHNQTILSLRQVGVHVYQGLIFVALTPYLRNPFATLERTLDPLLPWHGLEHAKVACRRSYPTTANWKLVVENFLECFHCFSNHPELCSVYSHPKLTATMDPARNSEFLREAAEWEHDARMLGHPTGGTSTLDSAAPQFCVAFRMPIRRGASSLSSNGEPLAPLMGNFREFDGGETSGFVGPLLHFSLANDHAMLIRIDPTDVLNTAIELVWLVHRDAVEGQDYDLERVMWLWDATVKQDRSAVELAQAGACSQYYVPGPYTDLETESSRFANWYRRERERLNYEKQSAFPVDPKDCGGAKLGEGCA